VADFLIEHIIEKLIIVLKWSGIYCHLWSQE